MLALFLTLSALAVLWLLLGLRDDSGDTNNPWNPKS